MKKIILLFFYITSCFSQKALHEIPFNLINNKIYLNVIVKNKLLKMMLDTGEYGTVFNIKNPVLKKINQRAIYKNPLQLNINNLIKKVNLIRFNNLNKYLDEYCDGILGIDFFKDYILEINYHKQVIKLYGSQDENIKKNYLKLETKQNDKNIELYKRFTTKLEISTVNGKQIFGDFIIDTGSSRGITTINSFQKLKNTEPIFSIKTTNASPHGFNSPQFFKIKSLTFNKKKYPFLIIDNNEDVRIENKNTPIFKGIIGGKFLKNFNIIIDFKKSQVFIKELDFKRNHNFITDGVKLKDYRKKGEKITIASIIEETGKNLQLNDRILKINNVKINKIDINKYRLNKNKIGSVNYYTVKRGKRILQFKKTVKNFNTSL